MRTPARLLAVALVSLAISSCQPSDSLQATINAAATGAAQTYEAQGTPSLTPVVIYVTQTPVATLQSASTDVAGTLTVTAAPDTATPTSSIVEATPCPVNSICEVGTPIGWLTVTPRPTDTPAATPTPGPIATPGNTDPQPTGIEGNWRMVFDDEFDGPTLDLNKWRPNWLGANDGAITPPVNANEASCYDPAQVRVNGGRLILSAVARPCDGYRYASGMVESNGHFNFTYGVVEARLYFSNSPNDDTVISGWPAFWLDGQKWPDDGELDIVEGLGGMPCYHYHSPAGAPGGCHGVGSFYGFHTFGAEWEPGRIDIYYDGSPVWSKASGVLSSPMFIVINMGLNASNVGSVPVALQVDYVRAWRKQ